MQEFVWLNDNLVPRAEARVPVDDRGFLYGDGFFETLRADDARVWFLAEHLARLRASAAAFRLPFPEDFAWRPRLQELLAANGLEQGPARVKILLSRGAATGLGLPAGPGPTLVIWASAYAPPPPAEYAAGWPAVVFPERRSAFLGRHKSLNYLFYLAARQFALDRGAREAIILEADGLVSEGAATSLIYLRQGRYFYPAAPSALPGATLAALGRGLERRGASLQAAPTPVSALYEAEGLWLANSLMAVLPVAAVDGQAIPVSEKSGFLQEILWAEARREK